MWAQSVSQKTLRTEAFRKTSLCGRQQRGEHRKEVAVAWWTSAERARPRGAADSSSNPRRFNLLLTVHTFALLSLLSANR